MARESVADISAFQILGVNGHVSGFVIVDFIFVLLPYKQDDVNTNAVKSIWLNFLCYIPTPPSLRGYSLIQGLANQAVTHIFLEGEMMKKVLLVLFSLAIVVSTQSESNAQLRNNKLRQNTSRKSNLRNNLFQNNNRRQNIGQQNNSRQNTGPPNARTPKVDFRMGHISRVGQGLAVHVRNQGTVASPKARVLVKVYDLQSRTLLQTKILNLGATGPNQQRRVIFVPNQSSSITVVAKVDPGNQVRESNERNNEIAIRF